MTGMPNENERTMAFAEIALGQIKSMRQLAIPRNFEIWYVYATGQNTALNKVVNETLARSGKLTEADLDQIHETVQAMVDRVGLAGDRWQFAYQSAGHTPEEWLTPDMKDLLPGIRANGHQHVLMAPVQFLSDHLEILYDVDVAAKNDAERLGINFHRIESLNNSPKFIRALAEVVLANTTSAPG